MPGGFAQIGIDRADRGEFIQLPEVIAQGKQIYKKQRSLLYSV